MAEGPGALGGGGDELDAAAEEVQAEIDYQLRTKGFCELDLNIGPGVLSGALEEVEALQAGYRFVPVQAEVVEGLLGAGGSSEFTELAFTGAATYADGPCLKELQETLARVFKLTRPYCKNAGYMSITKSLSICIRGGDIEMENELNEATCMGWLSTFKMARLMILLFLGPEEGAPLELTPYGDDTAGAWEVPTTPGTMVILRYDLLARRHISTDNHYTLCCWVWGREETGPRGWRSLAKGLQRKMPALRELYEWASKKMQHSAALEDEYGMAEETSMSREWQLMMHHHFFKNSRVPVAICGTGCHLPSTWVAEPFWKSMNNGIDFVTAIPFIRWDHDKYYDPAPNSWQRAASYKAFGVPLGITTVRHMMYIDGMALFDNKFFGLSNVESAGMDPQQRHILETSYECLHEAGWKKKELMNQDISVFIGTTQPEINYIDVEVQGGAMGGTGAAVAITSNRVSFQLGVMGASSSIDASMSGASMAIMVGCTSVVPNFKHRVETGGHSLASVVGGIFFNLTPFTWPRFNHLMSHIGRCRTFDDSADGHVRGDSASTLCLKPYAEKIDGEWTVPEMQCLGTLVGRSAASNGRVASLTAPSSRAHAETLVESVRFAGLNPLDIDVVECHGIGGLLEDSVETSASAATLRGLRGGNLEVLLLKSSKSHTASPMEACGAVAILHVIFNILYGTTAPGLLLRCLNPHIETGPAAMQFPSEGVGSRERTSFQAMSSLGWGGTNVTHVLWYMADETRMELDGKEVLDFARREVSLWPGGGGMLDREEIPSLGYFATGSFCQWADLVEMEKEGSSDYACTIRLGVNRFEAFQILLDGDEDRVLHPTADRADAGTAVAGPSSAEEARGRCWVIEGRSTVYPYRLQRPEGLPGDRFRIRLQILGRYRSVTWERLDPDPKEELLPAVDDGTYFVAGSWSGWALQEMTQSDETPGLHFFDLSVQSKHPPRPGNQLNRGYEFQIVRDRDWCQTFYPARTDNDAPGDMLGPDDCCWDQTWSLGFPTIGDTIRIEFQRMFAEGNDHKTVSWRPINKPVLAS